MLKESLSRVSGGCAIQTPDRRPELDELLEDLFAQRDKLSEGRERIARAFSRLGVQDFPQPECGICTEKQAQQQSAVDKIRIMRALMHTEASELHVLADRLETFI